MTDQEKIEALLKIAKEYLQELWNGNTAMVDTTTGKTSGLNELDIERVEAVIKSVEQ